MQSGLHSVYVAMKHFTFVLDFWFVEKGVCLAIYFLVLAVSVKRSITAQSPHKDIGIYEKWN